MVYQEPPMIFYLRQVLDEHTIILSDKTTGLVEAEWLVDLIHRLEEYYKKNGTL